MKTSISGRKWHCVNLITHNLIEREKKRVFRFFNFAVAYITSGNTFEKDFRHLKFHFYTCER